MQHRIKQIYEKNVFQILQFILMFGRLHTIHEQNRYLIHFGI